MKKRVIGLFLTICMLVGVLPIGVLAADTQSGKCGANAAWSYDTNTKTLTISGTGAMEDYNYDHLSGDDYKESPWDEYREEIESVIVGNGITKIGNDAFGSYYSDGVCPNLNNVVIGSGVQQIGDGAFAGAEKLESIELQSVTSIGEMALAYTGLESIYIPASVETIMGDGTDFEWTTCFQGCINLQSITVASGNPKYRSEDGVLFAENTLLCYPAGKTDSSYVIPSGTAKIAGEAFRGNNNITAVSVPASVQKIGSDAFMDCISLQKADLAEGITSVASTAFSYTAVNSLVLPSTVINYTSSWFYERMSTTTQTLYFTGKTAPTFDTRGCTTNTIVCYPESATGWDTVQQQDDVKHYIENGWLEFRTGTPPTEPSEPTDELKLVSTSPASGASDVAKNAPLVLTFNEPLSTNPNWLKGSIYIKDYETDVAVLTIDSAKFYSLGGTISGKTMTIPGVFSTLCSSSGEKKYYVSIDPDVITDTTNTAKYAGILDKSLYFRLETALDGIFHYLSSTTGKTEAWNYTYDENWFLDSSTTYSHNLATMSLTMAMAAFDIGGSDRAANIKYLFDQLGFEYTTDSISYPVPTEDTIGYAIGSKMITTDDADFTLVAVAIRGGGYGAEWASNFNVGKDEINHSGFSNAADEVYLGIVTYINQLRQQGCDPANIKIWITGYSRAAATANITAALIDKRISSGQLPFSKNNIFAYCFECPLTTIRDNSSTNIYGNIFNIINYADVVTKVAPQRWNFIRYGIDMFLPSCEQTAFYSDAYNNMRREYDLIMKSRDIENCDSYNLPSFTQTTWHKGFGTFLDNVVDAIASCMGGTRNGYHTVYEQTMMRLFCEGTVEKVVDAIPLIVFRVPQIAVSHPLITDDLIANLTNVAAGHYPELCLAWMQSLSGKSDFVSYSTRHLRVNCPVNVRVYDSSNILVAEVIDNVVQDITESTIAAYIDEDDQIVFILPIDEEYHVEIEATDNGEMTYTISEHNTSSDTEERVVSYQRINIEDGDLLAGTVENLNIVTQANYALNNGSTDFLATVDQSGEEVQNFSVTVSVSGNGSASGGGNYISGEFAKVSAAPTEGEQFLGWYINGALVSTESEYRFLVNATVQLVAQFTSEQNTDAPYYPVAKDASPFKDVSDSAYYYDAVLWAAENGITGGVDDTHFAPNASCTRAQAVTFLWRAAGSPAAKSGTMPFTDVPAGSYYYDAVLWAVENGITKGISDTAFSPDATCSRAQIVTFLWRSQKSPAADGVNSFTDVAADTYYANAVLWAAETGVTSGTTATTFSPNSDCTRAQIVTFLFRCLGGE